MAHTPYLGVFLILINSLTIITLVSDQVFCILDRQAFLKLFSRSSYPLEITSTTNDVNRKLKIQPRQKAMS